MSRFLNSEIDQHDNTDEATRIAQALEESAELLRKHVVTGKANNNNSNRRQSSVTLIDDDAHELLVDMVDETIAKEESNAGSSSTAALNPANEEPFDTNGSALQGDPVQEEKTATGELMEPDGAYEMNLSTIEEQPELGYQSDTGSEVEVPLLAKNVKNLDTVNEEDDIANNDWSS